MKESPTDDLFELIKSMSRSEKRYFTLDAKKGSGTKSNSYLKLFDALNSMDEYDETRLYKKLKGEPLLARLTTEKNYLYYAILKSMRNYWSDKSVYSRIKDMILNANYLLDRGLYEQSEKMLKKAKKLAKEYEQSASLLEINKLERTVYMNLRKRNVELVFKNLVDEKNNNMLLLQQEMKSSDYRYLLFPQFAKQKQYTEAKNREKLKADYSLEEINIEEIDSIHAKYNVLYSQCLYFRLLGEFNSAFICQSRIIEWWEENPEFKVEEFPKYITDLSNTVSLSYLNKRLDLIPEILEKIETAKPNNFHGEKIVFQNIALLKVLYLLNICKFDDAVTFVEQIETSLNKYHLDKQILTSIIGNFAILYFLNNNFLKSIKWINQIIESKKVIKRQDVQRFIRILKLICLYELDRNDELENAFRSVNRYIEATTTEKHYTFEFEVFGHLKRIYNAPLNELNSRFSDFKAYLTERKNSPGGKSVQGLDEYLFWVESKIQKRTIVEVMKEQLIINS